MSERASTASGWMRRGFLGALVLLVLIRFVGGGVDGEGEDAVSPFDGARQAVASAQAQESPTPATDNDKPTNGDLRPKEVKVLKELKARRESLREEQDQVEKTRERMAILREKMNKDLDQLKRYRDQIQTGLKREDEIRSEKMEHLVSVYSNMNPEKAAERIDRMERETAVKLLSGMTGKAAGRILSFVQPDKANEISQAMTKMVDEVQ